MDQVESLLTEVLGGDAGAAAAVLARARADGVTDLATAALVREEEWAGYGVPKIKARVLVAGLQQARTSAPASSSAAGGLLPNVPDDAMLLQALRVGGISHVEPTDVVAAIRASFAEWLGIYRVEERILDAIEERARSLDEPCPPIFYELQRSRARKAHADVLAALDIPGTFVTDRRKRELLARMGRLWDALAGFQGRIEAWQASWQERVANPGALLAGIAAMVSGQGGSIPPGMMEAPDTGPVVDAAATVVDAVNRVFAGPGIPVARALAADAMELRVLVERPDLPDAVGTATREEMLKKLGLGVSSDMVRAERSVTQYVLGLMGLRTVEEQRLPMVIVALKELGATIPWDHLRDGPARR